MKVKTLSLLAGSGSLLLAGTASAAITGAEVHDMTDFFMAHPNANIAAAYANAGLRTYRVYATFDAADIVQAWGGDGLGNSAWMNSNDGAFYNVVDSGYHGDTHYNFAPTGPEIGGNAARGFDTFGTIGAFVNSSAGAYASANELATAGGNFQANWELPNQGYFITPDANAEGTATLTSQGIAEDGVYRVLLFQASVADVEGDGGPGIEGNLGFVGGLGADGIAFESTENLGFSTAIVPAPGVLALLGAAGLVGVRRRR